VASDPSRPIEVRVQAAATLAARVSALEPSLFGLLTMSLQDEYSPLVRLQAAEALGKSRLDDTQLKALTESLARCGVLEVPKLLPAFERSTDGTVGAALVAALERSSGLGGVSSGALQAALQSYPEAVRRQAEPLVRQLTVDVAKQQSRLAELSDVASGGDIQRGRDLFFGNKKAICATCHAVQGQGGKFGPDLTKIGAIRTPRDLVEAIVFPSASFARGYEPFTIVTDSGQALSGIISRETADAVYLVNNARVETRIARSAIEALHQSTVSIMPEGMDAQLSRQELGDLIAFLQSLR
jgi:putative heme-binding domain-containing protein